jgi:hypothetical protein
MDWRCGSSGKVTGLQVLSPEFKPHFHQEKKKKIEEIKRNNGNMDFNFSHF